MNEALFVPIEGGFKFQGTSEDIKSYLDKHIIWIREMVARKQQNNNLDESQAVRQVMKQLFLDVVGLDTLEDMYMAVNLACNKYPEYKDALSSWWQSCQRQIAVNE